MSKLAMIQLDDYRREDLLPAFKAAFAELGLTADFKPAEKIVIKPNMLSGLNADRAVTSHPEVFHALAVCLRDLGVELSFGDSPALDAPEKAARASGLLAAADELGIPMADFVTPVETPLPQGKVLRTMALARGVAEADGLVSLAKLKTHALAGMTGAIKNQFGVITGQLKAKYHVSYPILEDFCQMLVDINQYLQPRLYVIDAIVAMEGNGPRNGHPRKVGVVLLSRDPVAADAAGTMLMGMEPASVMTTKLGARAGMGKMDLTVIDACLIRPVAGQVTIEQGKACNLLKALQVKDFERGRIVHEILTKAIRVNAPLYKRHIMRRPQISLSRCTTCGVCVTACPVVPKVLSQSAPGQVPTFDYARCIRCFCCQELCPAGAIEVYNTKLGRILKV